MGDYKGARTYHEQSLAMERQVHGEEALHVGIAVSLYALGSVCDRMGDYKGARTYHEQSLAMRRKVHGEEALHADIASSLHALGGLCYEEGNLAAAKLHLEEALSIWSATLPLTHPHIKQVEGELQAVDQQIEQQKHDPRYQQQQKLRAKIASRQAKQANSRDWRLGQCQRGSGGWHQRCGATSSRRSRDGGAAW
jgi:tetratricopeptide (TPR) repeat protein